MTSSRYALCMFILYVEAEVGSKVVDDVDSPSGAHLLDEARQFAVAVNLADLASETPKDPRNSPVSFIDALGMSARTQRKTVVISAASAVNMNKAPPDHPIPDSVAKKNDNKPRSQLDASKGDDDSVALSIVFPQRASARQRQGNDNGDDGAAQWQVPLMLARGGDTAPTASAMNSTHQTSNDVRAASPSFVQMHHGVHYSESLWFIGLACFLTLALLSFTTSVVHDDDD